MLELVPSSREPAVRGEGSPVYAATSLWLVKKVLIASDSPAVQADVKSVLHNDQYDVTIVGGGEAVLPTMKKEKKAFDLAVLDMQMSNMGGMATCLDLRLEHSAGRLPEIPVLLLLDRRADVFLARRASAHGWVLKPLDPIRLRRAIKSLLDGGRFEDSSFAPTPTVVVPS